MWDTFQKLSARKDALEAATKSTKRLKKAKPKKAIIVKDKPDSADFGMGADKNVTVVKKKPQWQITQEKNAEKKRLASMTDAERKNAVMNN